MDYDTSRALTTYFFRKYKEGSKIIELRLKKIGEVGDIIRFMKGYNPKNGVLFRRIIYTEQLRADNLTVRELWFSCVDLEFLRKYLETANDKAEAVIFSKKIWVHYLEKVGGSENG